MTQKPNLLLFPKNPQMFTKTSKLDSFLLKDLILAIYYFLPHGPMDFFFTFCVRCTVMPSED